MILACALLLYKLGDNTVTATLLFISAPAPSSIAFWVTPLIVIFNSL